MGGRTGQAELRFTDEQPAPARDEKARRMAVEDRICARIILSDAERFGGEGALPVQWAQRVMGGEAA